MIEDFNEQENCILLVGNIPWYIKTSQITQSLSISSEGTGKIIPKVSVLVDKSTGKSKGYAIVRYPSPTAAKVAFENFSDVKMFDVEIFIRFVNIEHVKNLFYYNFGDTRINRNTPNIRFINSLRPHFLVPLSKEAAEHEQNKVYFDEDNDRTLHESIKLEKELNSGGGNVKRAKVEQNKPVIKEEQKNTIASKSVNSNEEQDKVTGRDQIQIQRNDKYNKYNNLDSNKTHFKTNVNDSYNNKIGMDGNIGKGYSKENERNKYSSNRDNWKSHNSSYNKRHYNDRDYDNRRNNDRDNDNRRNNYRDNDNRRRNDRDYNGRGRNRRY